jgi:hypothetical protein
MKKVIRTAAVFGIGITAAINVQLNESSNTANLSLKNLEAMSLLGMETRECVTSSSGVTPNGGSVTSYQICPSAGIECGNGESNNVRGYINESTSWNSCFYNNTPPAQ